MVLRVYRVDCYPYIRVHGFSYDLQSELAYQTTLLFFFSNEEHI